MTFMGYLCRKVGRRCVAFAVASLQPPYLFPRLVAHNIMHVFQPRLPLSVPQGLPDLVFVGLGPDEGGAMEADASEAL